MSAGLEADRVARAELSRLAEPGDPRVAAFVAELGATEVVRWLRAGHDLGGLFPDAAARLPTVDGERELEQAARLGIRFVVPGDDEWPSPIDGLAAAASLHRRGGVPMGLWVKGPLRLSSTEASVAVVGSRSATTYGMWAAKEIAASAVQAGMTVVSGAAYGVDQAAHRGAIGGRGPTVAVLACGVDKVYPLAHAELLRRIGEAGAVVSEVPPGGSPTRIRFLARNRLIAALCRGTVVTEAAVRSGALNTAHWTERLHRPVMGVPGPISSATSQGVHQRIRLGAATLVTSGEEVLELLGAAGEHTVEEPRSPDGPRDGLSLREQQVLDAVPVETPAGLVSITRTAGVAEADTRSALTRMQSLGFVEEVQGRWRLGPAARLPTLAW